MNMNLIYSSQNVFSAGFAFVFPSPIPRTSIESYIYFDNFFGKYFGEGNDSHFSNGIRYNKRFFLTELSTLSSFNYGFKLANKLAFRAYSFSPLADCLLPDLSDFDSAAYFSIKSAFMHDSRDNSGNPREGGLRQVSAEVVLGSSSFFRYSLDLRQFIPTFHAQRIALRALYRYASSDAPFYMLPNYGGAYIGRGFEELRFTAKHGLYFQGEYRFLIASIFESAFFLDLGQFHNDASDFRADAFHPGFGTSLRFVFDANAVLSFDFAMSDESLSGVTPGALSVVFRFEQPY